ncbi:DNA-binding protein [Pandoraea cepalis]|uniref:DNA-binding protein n=1 Tax=Pandoraea cepalis TaxID=2508294 RepID=A0AAW7MHL8_9BURK|nr:DNA-binding protein [Pandoraea cepalis]MDN4576858.1 DNA-binding protein [Pandoraea cepalis]
MTGLSRSLIHAKLKAGEIRRPISLSSKVIRRVEAEALTWLTVRFATRTTIVLGTQSTI